MEFIIQNQNLILPLLGALLAWIIGLLWKKQVDKAKVVQILTIILDIVQDIANEPDTRALQNHEKKALAVSRVTAALDTKKKNVVAKVFGSIGAAIEFVWKNRHWLFNAAGRIIKAVI